MVTSDAPCHIAERSGSSLPVSAPGIAESAESRLRGNSYLALKNVSCDYHDGVLILRGCLPTYYLKQMAQAAVARIAGVERVVNEIEVMAPYRRDVLRV
jgi:osmotically-inducible protein OsmY